MPLITWSDKFAIGIQKIDDQHRRLFELTNETYDRINSGTEKQAIAESLNALIDYTRYHFKEEEDYMFNVEYTRFEQHKIAHDNLTSLVFDFQHDFSEGKGDAEKFIQFLYEWLTKHIMDQDKKIGKFMEMKILRPILQNDN